MGGVGSGIDQDEVPQDEPFNLDLRFFFKFNYNFIFHRMIT